MTELQTEPLINADVAESINYASWQNSVPLLRSIKVNNVSAQTLSDLRLEISSSPPFLRTKTWQLERLKAGDELDIRDRDVQLDPDYLNGLNEAERGEVSLVLTRDDEVLASSKHHVRILARDEWGGLVSNGELLAAFVMPNDPAVNKLLKAAAKLLGKHGHSTALDGYQTSDPRRAYMLAAAVWSSISAQTLTYANPPRSFEKVGQKTRRPNQVLSDGLATCLDTSMLFAAALEAVGLNSVIVMTDGHCFAGVWIVDKTFNRIFEPDCTEVRKALASRELVTFETTLVTHQPPAHFEDAIKTAKAATTEKAEGDFVGVIDITRCRMAQIRPLASHDQAKPGSGEATEASSPLSLPALPKLGGAPAEATDVPTTPDGRIERWQRKLLDLSLRNSLLNFRPNKQSIPLICPNIAHVEDQLSGGVKLRLISLREQNPIGERDAELHRNKTNEDLDTAFAETALEKNELSSPLELKDLRSRLTTIYRKVRNDLAEGGSNTLYLAVGFLRWKQKETDKRVLRAPLLLIPVKLTRKSALSPFHVSMHEDETRFNATLIQLLKKDFARDLSRFEANLPTDHSGIDVPLILEQMRQEVRDIPGFEVVDESALGTFSFSKYLMWKDLVDRIDRLENNRVVRHLIRDPDKPFESSGDSIPGASEIDTRFEPQELIHPLPADSSQLAAVMAASQGKDFVLVGPPGTGKSQTIANMISQCLATGKTVLFVAEKTAALNVVYRRLRSNGLGNCCIELHSNKAERKKLLEQLEASWLHNRQKGKNDWVTVSERLKVRRDELNAYVQSMHREHTNGWSAFDAMGECVCGSELYAPKVAWSEPVQHDKAAYDGFVTVVDDLAKTFDAIDQNAALPAIAATSWSAGWERELLANCEGLESAANSFRKTLLEFCVAIGLQRKEDCSAAEISGLNHLAKTLVSCANDDVRILFHKKFAKFPAAVKQLDASIAAYRKAKGQAAADYDESLEAIPVEELDQAWRLASASFWPKSWFGRRKTTRLLQTYAASGTANPETDLKAIVAIRKHLAAIESNVIAGEVTQWAAAETDTASVGEQLEKANELRNAIVGIGKVLNATNQISKAVHPAIGGKSPDDAVFRTSQQFVESAQSFFAAVERFTQSAGCNPLSKPAPGIVEMSLQTTANIQQHRTQLQRWTAWCDVRKRAKAAGLAPCTEALQSGRVAPADLVARFRLAYARWWIPGVIDGDEVLRTFQQFKHEEAIEDFRRLDDLARSTASNQVRAAVLHGLPEVDSVPRKSELGLLRHQMGLKRPSKSIREVISGMPESFGKLARCLLMSPLSIAQYLPVDHPPFDVVIFDEASQIPTWDAIGAIARGSQTVIVGDPKQLPPTNFFGRTDDDEDDEELDDHEKDLESILDEATASGLPTLQLNWHYRSQHESLIAFSNWNYYGNKLVTFPAADVADRGVQFRYVPDAIYDRGKSKTNQTEAEAIVADAVKRMKQNLELSVEDRSTFGVITFNSQQQSLIQDLFDQAQRDNPELDWYFSDDRVEPTVVKNLENVQGDERGVMYFSITFGKDISGKAIPLTFGALNRDGGERRLNVAITRAREQLLVFCSFRADELKLSKKRGVADLKAFFEYAEKGPVAIAARTEGSVGGYDSPFEEAVADALTDRSWQLVPQVGVSGFRVDLGVQHPDKPGAFLAGVECDGATYHRSAIARDRDKTRQQVLESLGWNILRVWSPDWWYDSASAVDIIDSELKRLLEEERNPPAEDAS